MKVDRCVCNRVTFSELKALADATGADLKELQKRTKCGTTCGLCIPYIRLMLRTGNTEFAPAPPETIEQLLHESR